MNVSPAGPGSTDLWASLALAGIQQPTAVRQASSASAVPTEDQVAALLQLLAMPEISDLILNIEQRLPEQDPASRQDLLQSAASALAAGDTELALAGVKELVIRSPRQAETIANEPEFQTIRQDIANLLRTVVAETRIQAEQKVATAGQAIAAGGVKKLPGSDVELVTVLSLATRFLETGRLADYWRASELAQVVIGHYGWAPTMAGTGLPEPRRAVTAERSIGVRIHLWLVRLKQLWRRAPLLVLLLGWLAVGIFGGACSALLRKFQPDVFDPSIAAIGFSIWGLGFLALVGFGFYMRIRSVRF